MSNVDQADFEPRVADWLEDDPNRAPEPALQVVLAALPSIKQRRVMRPPRRFADMTLALKLAVGALAVIVVAIGGAWLLGQGSPAPGVGGAPIATASQTPGPTARAPIPTVPAEPKWTAYTSDQYGFTIGHPGGWTVSPAARAWSLATDVTDWLSPAHDAFLPPDGRARVSAWSVDLPLGTIDSAAEGRLEATLTAWVEDYCQASGNADCARIAERAEPICIERRDCHPNGLLVPFGEDVHAFILDADRMTVADGDRITIVAVWRPESDPSVVPYGGAQSLLEDFLATMDVWRVSSPDTERARRLERVWPASIRNSSP